MSTLHLYHAALVVVFWLSCTYLVRSEKGGACPSYRRTDRNNTQMAFRPPPILYACPGSGDNEFRVLVDAALKSAGYLSGNMDPNKNQIDNFPGDGNCHAVPHFCCRIAFTVIHSSVQFFRSQGQSVILARPFTASNMPERSKTFQSLFGRHKGPSKAQGQRNQCQKCIKKRFSAAILLVRNPLRAAFIAYCEQHLHGHGWRMQRKIFVPQSFDDFALRLVIKPHELYRCRDCLHTALKQINGKQR